MDGPDMFQVQRSYYDRLGIAWAQLMTLDTFQGPFRVQSSAVHS